MVSEQPTIPTSTASTSTNATMTALTSTTSSSTMSPSTSTSQMNLVNWPLLQLSNMSNMMTVKLDNSNYIVWKHQISMVLETYSMWLNFLMKLNLFQRSFLRISQVQWQLFLIQIISLGNLRRRHYLPSSAPLSWFHYFLSRFITFHLSQFSHHHLPTCLCGWYNYYRE